MTTTSERYYQGTGRRKTSTARVRLTLEQKRNLFLVDGVPLEERFPLEVHRLTALEPLVAANMVGRFSITANLAGGGVSSQAGALRHGIARALLDFDESLRPLLKKAGFLTRDARMKERKKYGLFRARKKQQYSKR